MQLLGKILGLLVILWLGCMALNLMDSYGMISPPATKHAVPAIYNPNPSPSDITAMGKALGEVAKGAPRKTDNMSDLDWCLADEKYWLASGAEVPANSECQGQTMAYWHAQRKVAS
jgi:hypothetical protein